MPRPGRTTSTRQMNQPDSTPGRATSARARSRHRASTIIVVVVILILLLATIAVAGHLVNDAKTQDAVHAESEPTTTEVLIANDTVAYNPTYESFDTIPGASELTTFNLLSGASSTDVSSDNFQALDAAISKLTDKNYEVSFVLVNLDTGAGCAYNVDEQIYSASSIKAHYLSYLCQELVDTGQISLERIRSIGQATIVNSDNNAYQSLHNLGDGLNGTVGFSNWLETFGVEADFSSGVNYPNYAARDGLKMWFNLYQYLTTSNTEAASWLNENLGETGVSFIREALQLNQGQYGSNSGQEIGEARDDTSSITVRNKAGWINGTRKDSLVDGGIVNVNGATYLAVFMTSAPDSDADRRALEDIIRAAWALSGPAISA